VHARSEPKVPVVRCEALSWPTGFDAARMTLVKCGTTTRKHNLATPNYGYEKRQKELAKKRKKEDKLKEKAERKGAWQTSSSESPQA
jgi:hypothetical protein